MGVTGRELPENIYSLGQKLQTYHQPLQEEKITPPGEDDLLYTGPQVNLGQPPGLLMSKPPPYVLGEGHVGGHEDELIIRLEGGTTLVLEIHLGTLKEIKELGVTQGTEVKLVPKDHVIDPTPKGGEPVVNPHVVDTGMLLDPQCQAGLTGIGRTDYQEILGLVGASGPVDHDLIEFPHDRIEDPPIQGVGPVLRGSKSLLKELISDETESRPIMEASIALDLLLTSQEGEGLLPGSPVELGHETPILEPGYRLKTKGIPEHGLT